MKIEVSCRPKVDDTDTIRSKRAGESQDVLLELLQDKKQTLLRTASNVQKGFRLLVEEALKDNATTGRSRALQQVVHKGVWQAQVSPQQQQKQTQPQHAAVVRWETFLPHQQLQVLLVEDDDATRHIVGALLRNCSYEVTSASNGLLAWELLMDQNNCIDLVLTEVVMPCLSGLGLLGRIMNHGALKHIPVIMMSSHDSMNVVFKCLSKGAVDFLVKPVRKNELKNLWQHVWRRCHSSSASSCSHTQKTLIPNNAINLNESGTDENSGKTSCELNIKGGSDHGSGTQNPWTERASGADSGRQVNKLHSTRFRTGVGLRPAVKLEDTSSLGPEHREDKVGLKGGMSVAAAVNASCLDLVPSIHKNSGTAASVDDSPLTGHKDDGCVSFGGITQRVADSVGISKEQDSNKERHEASEDDNNLMEKHASNSPSSKIKLSNSSSPPPLNCSNNLELCLERPSKEVERVHGKGCRGVMHSSVSAFSRYNSRGHFIPLIARTDPANTHTPHVGFGSRLPTKKGGHGVLHTLSAIVTLQKGSVTFPNRCSGDAAAQSLLETGTDVQCLAQVCPLEKHGLLGKEDTPLPPAPGSFHASKQVGIAHVVYLGADSEVGESGESKDYCISYKQDELVYSHTSEHHQYHHHSHHHHHIQHHYYHVSEENIRTRPETPQPNDQTVTHIRDGAPGWGYSSNMENGIEGNIDTSGSSNGYGSNGNAASSVNGSATGSNNGCNGVQSAAAVLPVGGKDLNNLIEEDNGLHDVIGVTGSTENSFRREAALTKFRQKRKERCFEKKVCYLSQKRLADQRPRVQCQFVKQIIYEPTVEELEPS